MDILRGFSKVCSPSYGDFFIKHLDTYDSEEIDEKGEEYKNHAIKQGLPSTEEKLEQLKEDGSWTEEEDKQLQDLQSMVINLRITKSKFVLKLDTDSLQKQIDDTGKEINELLLEKINLIGYTSDVYASKKINEFYVINTSYKDKELKEPLFSKDEFEELQEKDITLLIRYYNEVTNKAGEENIKRIALSAFFLNNFYLCEDNPQTYYGKPVVDLTYNQGELFIYGRYFKHILSEMKNKPHPEVMDDPDKLIELYNVGQNADKMKQSMENADATTVVGATNEDLERMGLKGPSDEPQTGVSLQAEAAKKGGKLSMEDLMKLHS
jgi:hypothetical protein|tara:strand:+ start:676 stop:1644 length:969 start_codon:yes stop_codon:yes gene_type:complete